MTTIAYRDGIIACDSLVTAGGVRVGAVDKIVRSGPLLAGAAGSLGPCQKFLRWVRSGEDLMEDFEDFDEGSEGFVVFADGSIASFDDDGRCDYRAPYIAIGSGASFALGAMAHGASAEEAVRAASEHDTLTGLPIQTLAATTPTKTRKGSR